MITNNKTTAITKDDKLLVFFELVVDYLELIDVPILVVRFEFLMRAYHLNSVFIYLKEFFKNLNRVWGTSILQASASQIRVLIYCSSKTHRSLCSKMLSD